MQHRKSSLFLNLAALLVIFLQLFLQYNAVETARKNPALGVQFAAPITAEQFMTVLTYQQSDANTGGITASFWGSKQAAVSTDFGRKAEDTTCIGYAGSAADCLPAVYQQGIAPGAVGRQCAISAALALTLFGSNDIVGQTVTLDRTDYLISGVFTSDACTLLYPAKDGFTHAELRGISTDAPKADALQWAVAAGLPAPQTIDYGPQKVWLANALCHLPAVLVGMCLLAVFLRMVHGLPSPLRHGTYFLMALIFALLLPYYLQGLPGWLIPTRWSDFSFWPRLIQEILNEKAPG